MVHVRNITTVSSLINTSQYNDKL